MSLFDPAMSQKRVVMRLKVQVGQALGGEEELLSAEMRLPV